MIIRRTCTSCGAVNMISTDKDVHYKNEVNQMELLTQEELRLLDMEEPPEAFLRRLQTLDDA